MNVFTSDRLLHIAMQNMECLDFRGKVLQVEVWSSTYKYTDDKVKFAWTPKQLIKVVQFDEHGNLNLEGSGLQDGVHTKYGFDNSRRRIAETVRPGHETENDRYVCILDEANGRAEVICESAGKIISKHIFTLDRAANSIEENWEDGEGRSLSKRRLFYDREGKLLREEGMHNSAPYTKAVYGYDELGKLLWREYVHTHEDYKGYQLDDHGNWIERTEVASDTYYESDRSYTKYYRKITYRNG